MEEEEEEDDDSGEAMKALRERPREDLSKVGSRSPSPASLCLLGEESSSCTALPFQTGSCLEGFLVRAREEPPFLLRTSATALDGARALHTAPGGTRVNIRKGGPVRARLQQAEQFLGTGEGRDQAAALQGRREGVGSHTKATHGDKGLCSGHCDLG